MLRRGGDGGEKVYVQMREFGFLFVAFFFLLRSRPLFTGVVPGCARKYDMSFITHANGLTYDGGGACVCVLVMG